MEHQVLVLEEEPLVWLEVVETLHQQTHLKEMTVVLMPHQIRVVT
tara:strand:- start:302 stop:436 length:135 start_codon:yes stop_codon:yes gene_type:complete